MKSKFHSPAALAATLLSAGLTLLTSQSAFACPSVVTLTIDSSNYSGRIDIELRKGKRPGSKINRKRKVDTKGTVRIKGVCPGKYFFAFSTPESDSTSITSYFEVTNDGDSYSNHKIRVFYTSVESKGESIDTIKKDNL